MSEKIIPISKIHPSLRLLADFTKKKPFENHLWLVGGAVRDYLLGIPLDKDFDIVVEGDACELASLVYRGGLSTIVPVVYHRFGTALIQVAGANIELATARKESYQECSRKPKVEAATLFDDAKRRDFTINALLVNLHTGELQDPLGKGISDLEQKILRTPIEPRATFHEDPLRMLRAVRFKWQLMVGVAPGLYEAIQVKAERLKIISMERIRDELIKMLQLKDANACFRDLADLGLLEVFAPELVRMKGINQGGHHHLDVWEHSLLTLRMVNPGDIVLSLAALLHDIGKPITYKKESSGRIRFFGHEVVGANIAREVLSRLRFPTEIIDSVCLLIKNHARVGMSADLSDSALRRIIRDLGDQLERLILLTKADALAHRPGMYHFEEGKVRARFEEVAAQTPHSTLKSPLGGGQIMDILKISPGPKVGEVKDFLLEEVLEGRLAPHEVDRATKLILSKFHRSK